jgi:hypothetical protein
MLSSFSHKECFGEATCSSSARDAKNAEVLKTENVKIGFLAVSETFENRYKACQKRSSIVLTT